MSPIRRLIPGRREAPELWSKIGELNDVCLQVGKDLEATFSSVASGDRDSAIDHAGKIGSAIKKGSVLAREVRRMIVETSPDNREDIALVVDSLRALLGSAKETSRVLVERRLSPSVVFLLNDVKFQYTLSRLFEIVAQAVSCLSEAIKVFSSDPAKSTELSSSAKKMTEDIESAKAYLLGKLYEQEKSLDALSLIQLRDIILCESLLVDRFEDCVESLQMLASKS